MSTNDSRAFAADLRERSRRWVTAVNLHWAGVATLALMCLYLMIQMGFAWRLANSQDAEAMANQQAELKGAEIAARPLEGLDVKLAAANEKADTFYVDRLPMSYSEIATKLGALKTRTHVRLSRVNYSQPTKATSGAATATANPVPDSGPNHLTEVLMDASLAGDYRELVTFINSLEREKVFFLIDGVTLTGQQTGQVSLRIRLTTYLRGQILVDELARANAEAAAGELDKAVETQDRKAAGATAIDAKASAAGGAR
jgi:type IV pilus assembly protein PilO